MLKATIAIACHYLSHNEEVDEFLRLVPEYDTTEERVALAPRIGETVIVDRDTAYIEGAAA